MYGLVIFLHLAGVVAFLLAHGASANVAFKLRREKNLERIRALLELSTDSYSVMYGALGLILLTGIVGGFIGNWWGRGWIWASLLVLIALTVLMSVMGLRYYGPIRKAAGMPYFEKFKEQPAQPPVSEEEIAAQLVSSSPLWIAALGALGLGVLLWLMMFKPF